MSRELTLPAAHYFELQHYKAESESVFRRHWSYLGDLNALDSEGSYLAGLVDRVPVVVIRQKDGRLRGFINICRHRAATILGQHRGVTRYLRCPYHGWSYGLNGELVGAPECDKSEKFFSQGVQLEEIEVKIWGAFVFVKLDGDDSGFDDVVRTLSMNLDPDYLVGFEFHSRREYDIGCNWKVFVDNYLDGGYHVPYLHPGLSKMVDMTGYRTEIGAFGNMQLSPLSGDNPQTRSGTMAVYGWVFPNFMVNVYDGVMDTNWVMATGPNSCKVIFDFYFHPNLELTEQQKQDSLEVSHQVQLEDLDVCRDVQKGLESGYFNSGPFAKGREAGAKQFHQMLRDI